MIRASKKKIIKLLFTVPVIVLAYLTGVSGGDDFPAEEYFQKKNSLEYAEALAVIARSAPRLTSNVEAEASIFRVSELVSHPGLFEEGLRAFKALSACPAVSGSSFLRARLEIEEASILIKQGNAKGASDRFARLGFVTSFYAIGPFASPKSGGFSAEFGPEREFSPQARYPGKLSLVGWFSVRTDPACSVDFSDLAGGSPDSMYFLRTAINIAREGNYVLLFGKSGAADLAVDGMRVFQTRSSTGFSHDQYAVRVFFERGMHTLLVKMNTSARGDARFSVRITDGQGNPASFTTVPDSPDHSGRGRARLQSAGFFPTLGGLLSERDKHGRREAFLAGYLLYAAGLSSDENRDAAEHFQKAADDPTVASEALYYLSMISQGSAEREQHLYSSMEKNPSSLEPLCALARYRIGEKRVIEAFPLIKSVRDRAPGSREGPLLVAESVLRKGWFDEALKHAKLLREKGFEFDACAIEGRVLKTRGLYAEAAGRYRTLSLLDRSSFETLDALADCLVRSARPEEAIEALQGASAVFPNSIALRLRCARIAVDSGMHARAIPFLSSALRLYPYNRSALLDMGLLYHRMGSSAAEHFMRKAAEYDPTNFSLRRYLDIITGRRNELEPFLYQDEPARLDILAAPYRKEPAVNLINEMAIRVMEDGSFEKWVHRMVKINDASAVEKYARQTVVLNPSTDRLEYLSCEVVNGGERVSTSESYQRSLSDPESRLYYDLVAHVVTAPSLRPGSVMSFKYRIHSKSGETYKNYFGTEFRFSDENRTLKSQLLISAPASFRLACHLKGADAGAMETLSAPAGKIVRCVRLDGVAPRTPEPSMPHESEFAPSVRFTSFDSWASLSRWYWSLYSDRIVMSEEMRRDLAAVIAGAGGNMEKVRRIFNHVTSRIRYVGFELGLGGLQPRRSDETYHSGMGDCKDITLVLVALLRAAGIEAHFALVRTGDRGEADISAPYLGIFNHAICYVEIAGGFFLDGTARFSGFREIPDTVRNATALVIRGGAGVFVPVSSDLYEQNRLLVHNEVKLYPDGSARIIRELEKKGGLYAPQARYNALDRESLRTTIDRFWNDVYTGSKIYNLTVDSAGRDEPVSYRYIVHVPRFAPAQDGELIFRSFFYDSRFYRDLAMLRERSQPIVIEDDYTAVERIVYQVPDGYEVYRIPRSGGYRHKKFQVTFDYRLDEAKKNIEVESAIRYLSKRIIPEEYREFREFARFVHRMENERIILVKSARPGR